MKQQIKQKKPIFFWHIHHDVLLEPLTEPLKNRIKFIKENKPKDEIKLRLKLIKPVKGELPKEFIEAGQKCIEARQKCDEAGQKFDEAGQKFDEAWQKFDEARQKCDEVDLMLNEVKQRYKRMRQKFLPQLKALHKKECGCGYDFKKNTIFTKENGWSNS